MRLFCITGAIIFQISRTHIKILGARRVMWSKFYTEEPQTFGAKVKKAVTMTTRRPQFVHPRAICIL
jgi:hypothetical protein